MEKLPRLLGATLFGCALGALLTLLVSDGYNYFQYTAFHRKAGAWSFMLIGLSYIALQFRAKQAAAETVKKLLLGMGFTLWGAEMFLPQGWLATAVDTAVIVIFVVDLSLLIVQRLARPDADPLN
jgi:hypothetical protein